MKATRARWSLVLLIPLALSLACGARQVLNPAGTGKSTSAVIGSAGGELTLEGTRLRIPPGALTTDTRITITSFKYRAPHRYSAFSPVFQFQPPGTTFAKPVELSMTSLYGEGGRLVLYWSSDGVDYDPIEATSNGVGGVVAPVTHFSFGFIGEREQSCDSGACDQIGPTPMGAGVPGDGTSTGGTGDVIDCPDGSCTNTGGGGGDFGGPNCPGNICSGGGGGGGFNDTGTTGGGAGDTGTGGGGGSDLGGPNCPGNICGAGGGGGI